MPNKDQVYIFNDEELSLIKNTFAENDVLLYTIRKVLLQFPLSDVEKGLLKQALTPALMKVLRKRILPEIGNEFPLGQLPSLHTTLTQDLKVKDFNEMAPHFESKQQQLDYLAQQFAILEGGDVGEVIKLSELGRLEGKTPREQFVDMNTYLFLLGYIDPMLIMIKTIAGSKDETVEKQKERMNRNSSK